MRLVTQESNFLTATQSRGPLNIRRLPLGQLRQLRGDRGWRICVYIHQWRNADFVHVVAHLPRRIDCGISLNMQAFVQLPRILATICAVCIANCGQLEDNMCKLPNAAIITSEMYYRLPRAVRRACKWPLDKYCGQKMKRVKCI